MVKRIKSFLFENKTLQQTVLKNVFWIGVGQIGSRLIKGLLIIYGARILGASSYGAFSYVLSLAAFMLIFADLGINAILTRESAKSKTLKSQYFSTAFFIKAVLLAIASLLIIFIVPYFVRIKETKELLSIVVFLMVFDSLQNFAISAIRAFEKMEIEAGINIFANLSIVAFGLAAIYISPTAKSLLIGYAIGNGLGLLPVLWYMRKDFLEIFKHFNRHLIIKILDSGWSFAFLGFLGSIMINTDMLMLGWMRTAPELGFYSAAQKPILLIYLIPLILTSSLFPALSRLSEQKEKTRVILEKSLTALFLIALPMTAGGFILGTDIIKLLYGSGYLEAANTFKILIFSFILTFPSALIGNAILALDQQKKIIGYFALGAISNVIFNLALIPPYGIAGAAVATLIAQLLSSGGAWWTMKKISYFKILPRLPKIILAAILMTFGTFALKLAGVNLLINISLSTILYFGALYYLKEELVMEAGGLVRQ